MLDALFSNGAAWFGVPAVFGTAFFTLRLFAMFVGGDGGLDLDVDADVDLDVDASNSAFRALSIQSLSAFLMGFGWGGLGAWHGAGWSMVASGAFGLGAGVGMVWLLGLLLKAVHDLQSSGNQDFNAFVGAEGVVYVTVPGERSGRGQVQVVHDDRQRTCDAMTESRELVTRTRVRVSAVEGNVLLVVEA